MKRLFILFLLSVSQVSFAAKKPTKGILPLKVGAKWVLSQDLNLQKTGLTPEEFISYVRVWDLKSKSFLNSGFSSKDNCEFRTAISKKRVKKPAVVIKKASQFRINNIQETTMSIIIDILNKSTEKSEVDQIQITCSAYEFGLDSPELKQKFKGTVSSSLSTLFAGKN